MDKRGLNKAEVKVVDVLEAATENLSILEVAERARLHRVTAAKHLEALQGKNWVLHESHGRAKLYYLNPLKAVKEEIEVPAAKLLISETTETRAKPRAEAAPRTAEIILEATPKKTIEKIPEQPPVFRVQKTASQSQVVLQKVSPIQKLAALELCKEGLLSVQKASQVTGMTAFEVENWLKAMRRGK